MTAAVSAGSVRPMVAPFLALADVFICAVSIVFILLLLAEPERMLVQHPPKADYRLLCTQDGGVQLLSAMDDNNIEIPGASKRLTLSGAPLRSLLSGLETPTALSARVLIQAPPSRIDCAEQLADIMTALNTELSERLLAGEPGAYLLHDLEVIPEPGIDGATASGNSKR